VNEFFKAADDLNAKTSIPMHLGVIRLGREPVNYPLYEVEEYIGKNPEYRDRVLPMRINEYLSITYE
jgi:hypothetical protein